MFGALKILLPLGVGLAGLVALSGKAKADTLPGPDGGPRLRPAGSKMTREEAAAKMNAAIATSDPKVLLAVADDLEQAGFPASAKDLRGVAADLAQVGARAAGAPVPPAPSPAVATPPAAMPAAKPNAPEVAVIPPPSPVPAAQPPIVLPEMVVPGQAPSIVSNAARENVQRAVIMLNASKKWKENRDQVIALQNQEKTLGHYESFDPMRVGQPGSVDGLYGPGTAWAIAKFYGIVPPNPFYWPKNSAPAVALYKARFLELAAADPARAEEWRQAAAKAKAV